MNNRQGMNDDYMACLYQILRLVNHHVHSLALFHIRGFTFRYRERKKGTHICNISKLLLLYYNNELAFKAKSKSIT